MFFPCLTHFVRAFSLTYCTHNACSLASVVLSQLKLTACFYCSAVSRRLCEWGCLQIMLGSFSDALFTAVSGTSSPFLLNKSKAKCQSAWKLTSALTTTKGFKAAWKYFFSTRQWCSCNWSAWIQAQSDTTGALHCVPVWCRETLAGWSPKCAWCSGFCQSTYRLHRWNSANAETATKTWFTRHIANFLLQPKAPFRLCWRWFPAKLQSSGKTIGQSGNFKKTI